MFLNLYELQCDVCEGDMVVRCEGVGDNVCYLPTAVLRELSLINGSSI